MPKVFANRFDAAIYVNYVLPAIKSRIEADIEHACERGDFERAHYYASRRLPLVENRFWTHSPVDR